MPANTPDERYLAALVRKTPIPASYTAQQAFQRLPSLNVVIAGKGVRMIPALKSLMPFPVKSSTAP